MKRKTGVACLMASFLIVLTLALLLWTLWTIGQKDSYSYFTISSVMVELTLALLTATTYISVIRNGYRERLFVRSFLWMLSMVTLGALGDALAWGVGLEQFWWAPQAQALGAFFRDAMGFPLIVIYSIYLLSYINEEPRELKRFAWLVGGLCADGLLLVLINQMTSRSKTNPWQLADHPWLFFFFLAVPMVVNVGIIFYFRRMLTNRKAMAFLLYELLVLASIALDLWIQETTLAYAVAAFSLLHLYISVQLEYEKQQTEILLQQRISIMLSQIRPHFLYNVLTGIRALCRLDSHKAEEALVDFTRYLRTNLSSLENEELVPFSQELEYTKHYIRLEQMRYGDDLRVTFHTPVTQFFLPALTLEPMVENAVRHGVMQRERGGTITVCTAEEPASYLITVTDDGVGFDTARLNETDQLHVGVNNVRKRLAAMCGGTLWVESVLGQGTTVVLSIPKEKGTLL